MRPILAALAFALLCIAAGSPEPASAQSYPSRPVRIVVPLAPGGPTDVFARLIAGKLSENLGKQFFVENMPGAGGNIGLGSAAKAAPDGYTILVVSNLYVVNPTLYEKISYEPYRDFEPVTLALDVANVVAVNPSVPVKTLKELEVFIKANPGKHSYASGGLGTTPHLMGEQFRLQLGLDLVHVPFNSGGLAVGSAIAGHTPISFGALPPAAPLIKEGKLRALAVSGATRSPALPDAPTLVEAGYPQIKGDAWQGVFAPAGTPADIVATLNREIVRIIRSPEMQPRWLELGYTPIASSPQDFARQIKGDIEAWGKVIRAADIKVR
jgi:tripartite-type tricarboxylate transporter receptor subunit TctC